MDAVEESCAGREYSHQKQDSDMERDEYIINTISFLGERGRGKTSAMMSFLSYLNKLQKQGECAWSVFKDKKRMKFITLPCIDAAMLAQNEFLIDVVLAEMWDKFEDFIEQQPCGGKDMRFEQMERLIKENFVNVRNAYLVLQDKEKTKESKSPDKDKPAVRALHELAVSINLRKEFESLVNNYIRFFTDDMQNEPPMGCLILAIDDLDMGLERTIYIIEQMRRFLSIPHVILFLTADINRLKKVCENRYKDIYQSEGDRQRLVNDYLEKVLPYNMRIYMPELKDIREEYTIVHKSLKRDGWNIENLAEGKLILGIFAKDYGIYFDGVRRKRHFLQSESLRGLVSYFGRLSKLNQNDDLEWLKVDLQERLIPRIEDEGRKTFVESLLKKEYEELNFAVVNYIISEEKINIEKASADKKETRQIDMSLGQVLYLCTLFEKSKGDTGFVDCIVTLYTIALKQAEDEARRKIIGHSIFGEAEYNMFSEPNSSAMVKAFDARGRLELEITEKTRTILEKQSAADILSSIVTENKDKIQAWLYALLYTDIVTPVGGKFLFSVEDKWVKESSEESMEKQEGRLVSIALQPKTEAYKSVFGFLYRKQDEYKETLEMVLKGVIEALANEVSNIFKKDDDSKKNITELNKNRLLEDLEKEIFGQWETSMTEFQMHNVEILYSICRAFISSIFVFEKNADGYYNMLRTQYQRFTEELEKRDEYYHEIGIEAGLKDAFKNSFQVRLLLEPNLLKENVREEFSQKFMEIYREVITLSSPKQ